MSKSIVIVLLLVTLSGCTQLPSKPTAATEHKVTIKNEITKGYKNPEALTPDLYPEGVKPSPEPIIRYGRYNLTTATPSTEQQDLLAQIITTNIPANVTNPNVRDAMNYVMLRSGYSLCPITTSKEVNILYTRPLPAAHYKLGPITLRNALQILAGPAYQVNIDEVNRNVCFAVREDYRLPTVNTVNKINNNTKTTKIEADTTKSGVTK